MLHFSVKSKRFYDSKTGRFVTKSRGLKSSTARREYQQYQEYLQVKEKIQEYEPEYISEIYEEDYEFFSPDTADLAENYISEIDVKDNDLWEYLAVINELVGDAEERYK